MNGPFAREMGSVNGSSWSIDAYACMAYLRARVGDARACTRVGKNIAPDVTTKISEWNTPIFKWKNNVKNSHLKKYATILYCKRKIICLIKISIVTEVTLGNGVI